MNAQQAENLRILIRHVESLPILNMVRPWPYDEKPGCAICEARRAGLVPAEPCIEDLAHTFYAVDARRLFSGTLRVDGKFIKKPTGAQWAAEARKVLSENGYAMDEPTPAAPFVAFKERLLKPSEPTQAQIEQDVREITRSELRATIDYYARKR
jgi:hypothetical protein